MEAAPMPYPSPISRAPWATIRHRTIPVKVGTRKDTAVHLRLWVSFRMVHSVVAQGQ